MRCDEGIGIEGKANDRLHRIGHNHGTDGPAVVALISVVVYSVESYVVDTNLFDIYVVRHNRSRCGHNLAFWVGVEPAVV